jgi:hypothetical protein
MLVERRWPAHGQRGSDRGSLLGTVGVRPMWHVAGTAGDKANATGYPESRSCTHV